MAGPGLELRGGPGFDLLTLLALLPSVISSFSAQNKGEGGRAPPQDPPLVLNDRLFDPITLQN